jgi:hypothetical protein
MDEGLPRAASDVTRHTDDERDTLIDHLRAHLDAVDAASKTEHGRDAVVDIVRLLREHETLKTSAVKEALYPDYDDQYAPERSMWESLRRHLNDTPGVDTDAGYGQYGYEGDDDVREALVS